MSGPLNGIRIVEFEGIGPAPYCCMLLADMGAEIVRIARPSVARGPLIPEAGGAPIDRGRKVVTLDLKSEAGLDCARNLMARADGVVEGLRPGVMERLGLGPDQAMQANPALVYCRITGWGQEGPWASTAGHDLCYIALSGALAAIGEPGRPPVPPLNLVGDYGGGGLFAAFGMVSALLHARITGQGQVVDAAMLDGAASQMTMIQGMLGQGLWSLDRGQNFLDGAAPFYRCYTCLDGKFLAVGCIEPQFFVAFMQGIGLDPAAWDQADKATWPDLADAVARVLATRTRDEWAERFDGSDACVAPVLDMVEAPCHHHNQERKSFVGSPAHPAPAPRMPGLNIGAGASASVSVDDVLADWSA